ncbi:MAG: hypothetical protein BV457_02005 [Thermoplasmata archaeon M9B1D]|nr:MAG: hypothetical protein BV457_02005 [Thermoplasmata archaeon M9B1D]PNX50731.1 MAG: hypothetical protein BV456_05670 [Thermoplasmata archaeon M8B2D]
MALFDFAELSAKLSENLSIKEILSGNFSAFTAVLYLAISIAVYSIVIYHFYRYVARRDCFKPSMREHTKTIGFLKYFFLFPFVVIVFFLGFSIMLLFLAGGLGPEIVLSTSFAIILAIRICSYYTEDLSKDVAKMLPFALLGVFLVNPSYFELADIQNKINQLPELINVAVVYLIFLIIVEWILRIGLNIRYRIFPKKE